MNLLDQSPWWLLPFALLMLVMLHAMMEFTVSLLVQPPQANRKPIPADELRGRLLEANEADRPDQLVAGKDCDLEIYRDLGATPQPNRLAIAREASGERLRLLLDEQRHELRMNQVSRSYYYFFGLTGWLPRLAGFASFQSGPPLLGHPLSPQLRSRDWLSDAESGLRSLFIGFETLDPVNLREQHKYQNLDRDYGAAIRRLHGLGVMVNGSFVFGMDGDLPHPHTVSGHQAPRASDRPGPDSFYGLGPV